VLLELDFLAGADPDAGDRRRAVDDAKRAVRQALEEVRRIAQELRPEMLEQLGLKSALTELSRRFADQSGVTVRRRFAEGLPALSDEAELAVYRVAQESLTNVALTPRRRRWSSRSSRAWAASSCGSPTTGGAWARRRPATGHGGLRGMRERALLVGGALAIRDGHGGGVEIRLEVPAGEATAGASSPAERRSASRRSSDIRS
jgi:two-component system, NarL family, sensor histidine kinase UhpB